MTSSAEPRRGAATAGSPRKRVAGARRRQQRSSPSASTDTPTTSSALEAFTTGRTATATLERPSRPLPDEQPEVEASGTRSEQPLVDETPDLRHAGEDTPEGSAEASARRRSARLRLPASAVAVALALLVGVLAYALRPSVSDTDRTAAVSSARTTLESLLSYSGSSFDKHVDEVLPELAPPFKDQFSKVAASDIKPMAVKNEATVQAKVYEAGVMDTSGDGGEGTTVRVMAFVNQATTTKAQPTPAIDQNRVIATMRKTGDRWLISDLSAY